MSNAAGVLRYFPVSMPPASTLYAMKPQFSCKGEHPSDKPFSDERRFKIE